MIYNIKKEIPLLSIVIVCVFFASGVFAADCGTGQTHTTCECGDTVKTNYTFAANLTGCAGDGLTIGADGITIDGAGYTISGPYTGVSTGADPSGTGTYGIKNAGGYDNITIKNLTITGFGAGIFLSGSTGSAIQNNNISLIYSYGIYLSAASNTNSITGNTISSCAIQGGIYIASCDSNTITGNTVTKSYFGLSITGSSNVITGNTLKINTYGFGIANSNTFGSNKIVGNIFDSSSTPTATFSSNQYDQNGVNKMLTYVDPTRTYSVGDTISFNITAKNPDGTACVGCTTAVVYPSETITQTNTWASTNNPQGTFVPSKSGTYSLLITVTDSNSDVTRRQLTFIVGTTASRTQTYYMHGISTAMPSHGQAPGNGHDIRIMDFTAPTVAADPDIWTCGGWVQSTPDILPNYPVANISAININAWYLSDDDGALAGIQRYQLYNGTDFDYNITFDNTGGDYEFKSNQNFPSLNWQMDYGRSWYWMTTKYQSAMDPKMKTTVAQPSYTNFTYTYATTPKVKSLSNDNIALLSATAPVSDTSNATIVLDGTADAAVSGTGSTTVVLDTFSRPFQNYTTTISSDGTASLAATSITGITTISSVPLDITPNAGTIAVSITTWNTSGDYSKEWTETGTGAATATHTVGNLANGTYYNVLVDGTVYGNYQSNTSGQITFDYTGGYSAKTFQVQYADTGPVRSSGAPSGSLAWQTTSVNLSLITDETATCRYSTTSGTAYDQMTSSFELIPALIHTLAITVSANSSYTYYVRCSDAYDNKNTTDYTISFSVDNYPPKGGGGGGGSSSSFSNNTTTAPSNPTYPTVTFIKNSATGLQVQSNISLPSKTVSLGAVDNGIRNLQIFLNANGFQVSKTGVGSPGHETNIFGAKTKQALIKFQQAYSTQILKPVGLTRPTGTFGPSTRNFINSLKK